MSSRATDTVSSTAGDFQLRVRLVVNQTARPRCKRPADAKGDRDLYLHSAPTNSVVRPDYSAEAGGGRPQGILRRSSPRNLRAEGVPGRAPGPARAPPASHHKNA